MRAAWKPPIALQRCVAGGKLETIPTLCVFSSHPINMKSTIAAVMRAPLLAGESMPNIANTATCHQEEGDNQQTLADYP